MQFSLVASAAYDRLCDRSLADDAPEILNIITDYMVDVDVFLPPGLKLQADQYGDFPRLR
jgi:hypothetical protein